jgi:cytosine/adenosine deaminase-related metal-dependent hydrolase
MTNTTTRTITCAHLIAGAAAQPATAQRIEIAGNDITAVGGADGVMTEPLLALPVLVNAHDHGRAIRSSSIGAAGKPLESWLHHLALFPSVDPYLAAVVALSNSALGGTGLVMVHYTRAQGFSALPEEATEVARAARDVGVRVGFAVSMKNRNPLVYGASEPVLTALPPDAQAEIEQRFFRTPLAPRDQIALADAVADAAAGPNFDVQYGPNGVQWCSDALLEAVAEASQRSGRRVHMHLLETRYQRAWLDAAYPDGAVRHLDRIGLLTPRLTLAHCVWARPDELELLAERGVTIVVNTSSNLHLRSGIAPAVSMINSGCRIALGIDDRALDDDHDALRELRLSQLLHAGTGFTTAISQTQMLQAAFGNGRLAVTNSPRGGTIEPGAPADLLLLDWAALDDDGLREALNPLDLLFSRATARHIREVIVGGRTIVRDRRVLGVNLEASRREVLAQMRAGMSANRTLATAMPALDRAIAHCFEPDHPCC